MAKEVIIQIKNPSGKSFIMPEGFYPYMEVHCWGAGGGSGAAVGAGGGYAYSNVSVKAGDTIQVITGGPGQNASGRSAGGGGQSYIPGKLLGGAGGSSVSDGEGSGGAGGGAASAVLVNGVVVVVAAGGGGGGGYGDDNSAAGAGLPGGVQIGGATGYSAASHSAYCSFLNTYGIAPITAAPVINFPVTGTYTFYFSVDNYGSVVLDSTTIFNVGGEFNYGTFYTATLAVTAGNHTLHINGVNIGGPAAVAVQIIKPDTNELWNTRSLLYTTGLTDSTVGGTAGNGYPGAGGGGGGGYFGGAAGASYGDDASGGAGGNGGANNGQITIAGSGTTGAGKSTAYYPKSIASVGNAGYPGYVYIKLIRKPGLKIKNPDGSGNWVEITDSYVKRMAPTKQNKTFNQVTNTTYRIPDDVSNLSITYLTVNGLVTQQIPVTPGSTIPVVVGDYGSPSQFGSFVIPAYRKEVFRYVGNVDHITDVDVQVVTPTSVSLTSSGYNAGQAQEAADNGIYYAVTYEIYHGDLASTVIFNTVPVGDLLTNFRIVGSGGGRDGAPTITVQPTALNGYIGSFRVAYDPDGNEGSYDSRFTLEQQGYFGITYTGSTLVEGWKEIQNIYVKVGKVWKPVAQASNIVLSSI